MTSCFFAFSDKGTRVSDSINETVKVINSSGHMTITPWNVMSIQGTSIPMKVINSIDN